MRQRNLLNLLLQLTVIAVLLPQTNSFAQVLVPGSVVYEFNGGSFTPTNPMPFAANVSPLVPVGWPGFTGDPLGGNPGGSAMGSVIPSAPLTFNPNEFALSFIILPTCPTCVFTGFSFDAEFAISPPIFSFQMYRVDPGPTFTPVSGAPLIPSPGPTYTNYAPGSFTPQFITAPTQFRLVFDGTAPFDIRIDNLRLDFFYDSACIPEPSQLAILVLAALVIVSLSVKLKRPYCEKQSAV